MLPRCRSMKKVRQRVSSGLQVAARTPGQAAVMISNATSWAYQKSKERRGCKRPGSSISDNDMRVLLTDKRCRFDSRELINLRERWLSEHPKGRASKAELAVFVKDFLAFYADGVSGNGMVERMVTALDSDGDGKISFQETIMGLSTLLRGRMEDKVQLLFRALDADGNGKVSKEELEYAFLGNQLSNGSGVSIDDLMASGDTDGDGELDLEEFLSLVKSSPRLQCQCSVAEAVYAFNKSGASTTSRRTALRTLADSQNLFHEEDAVGCADPLSPAVVVRALSNPGLSPVAIGEFLSSRDDEAFFSESAIKWFQEQDLMADTLDIALRRVSTRVCFPREAQQIDRLLVAFSKAFCQSSSKVLTEDEAYLISFAVVMLNADLHSANVKKKMSRDAFTKNVPHVDKEMLRGIYDRVKAEEIKLGLTAAFVDKEDCPDLASKLGELAGKQMSATLGGLLGGIELDFAY